MIPEVRACSTPSALPHQPDIPRERRSPALSPGLPRSTSAHVPSCCARAFGPWSGSETSPG